MSNDQFPRAQSADVALLLEGTFPYVSGGVSSWVNQMIRAFPDIRFAIVFIGSRREDYGKPVYAIPDNVVHLECHYLYDFPPPPLVQASGGDAAAFERSRKLHDALRNPANKAETAELIRASIADLRDDGPLAEEQFLYSHRAWDMMTDYYRRYCTDPSFTDYFWTVRITHGAPSASREAFCSARAAFCSNTMTLFAPSSGPGGWRAGLCGPRLGVRTRPSAVFARRMGL